MKYVLEFPVLPESRLEPEFIRSVTGAAESAGLTALAFTDHPAPDRSWLAEGGHPSLDPFGAMAFCAGVTSRLRLLTRLVVAPYRNPFLLAKCITTVDVVSGGRAEFGLGVGYLATEFAALGVDFEERNALFDEVVPVLLRLWTGEPVTARGSGFDAREQVSRPLPIQRPHPPLWIGGNSAKSRQRAASYAQGWAPIVGFGHRARAARTPVIDSEHELGRLIQDLRSRLEANGRSPDACSVLGSDAAGDLAAPLSVDERMQRVGTLAELGVTHLMVRIPRDVVDPGHELLLGFGGDVISRTGG